MFIPRFPRKDLILRHHNTGQATSFSSARRAVIIATDSQNVSISKGITRRIETSCIKLNYLKSPRPSRGDTTVFVSAVACGLAILGALKTFPTRFETAAVRSCPPIGRCFVARTIRCVTKGRSETTDCRGATNAGASVGPRCAVRLVALRKLHL